jgi:predicted TIM-barrel fold metal-dependent hydrolase
VFGPQSRFPYLPNAAYIFEDTPPERYARMLRTIGCDRAVLVQPSVYGTDNRCMVDALKGGAFDFRGVAVVDANVPDAELQSLHEAGVRGVRINAASKTAVLPMSDAPKIAARIKHLGWHLQFFVRIDDMPDLHEQLAKLPVPCVVDHFAHVHAADGTASPAFRSLLGLAKLEHVWFKLIGAYRISTQRPNFPDTAPLAKALVAAAPDRCVWGTDWPHPNVEHMPNDGDLADLVEAWLGEGDRQRVMVDNPARLYDFNDTR